MYEAPQSDITDVIITEDVVNGKKQAEYIRRSPLSDGESYENDNIVEDEQISVGSNQ